MAETLGSLIDKLTIKGLREYHINEMMETENPKFPVDELKAKVKLLLKQKEDLRNEIDSFVADAVKKGNVSRDEKLKLYNNPDIIGKVGEIKGLADAIEKLGERNIQLWHLEDEARREDVELSYIGEIKRKIDVTNQSRNDFIDLIDEIFEQHLEAVK